MAAANNNGPPLLSLVRANAQGHTNVSNNRKVATQQTLSNLTQMGMLAPHQISTASITRNVAAAANTAANADGMNISNNGNYMTNKNGGRRRSRHSKKTRRNKRHSKKTRRNRKH
jgi:hypothetical protein